MKPCRGVPVRVTICRQKLFYSITTAEGGGVIVMFIVVFVIQASTR